MVESRSIICASLVCPCIDSDGGGNCSLTAAVHSLPPTHLCFDTLEHRHLRDWLARRASPSAPQFASLSCRAQATHFEAARAEGLEPSTYGLEIRCSIRLSYGRIYPSE